MVFYDRSLEPSQELTEDLFLQTLAAKICERFDYNIGRIDPIKRAISDLHTRQVKSSGSSHAKDFSFYEALAQKNPKYAQIIEDLQIEAETTLRMAVNDIGREDIYKSLSTSGSATFGQEISKFIGQAMMQKKTGTKWT